MTELSEKTRAFLQAARDVHAPAPVDRSRIHDALVQRLGLAGASAAAAPTKLPPSLEAVGAGSAAGKLVASVVLLVVAAGAGAYAVSQRSPPQVLMRSQASAQTNRVTPAKVHGNEALSSKQQATLVT